MQETRFKMEKPMEQSRESVLRQCRPAWGIVVTKIEPGTPVSDEAIYFGGKYDGVHLSLDASGYDVVVEMPNGNLLFIDGTGDLRADLERAVSDNDERGTLTPENE